MVHSAHADSVLAPICTSLVEAGVEYVAVTGGPQRRPGRDALKPLPAGTSLTGVSEHPEFEWGPRLGTFVGLVNAESVGWNAAPPATIGYLLLAAILAGFGYAAREEKSDELDDGLLFVNGTLMVDGRVVPGILFDETTAESHPEITALGGWREYLGSKADASRS